MRPPIASWVLVVCMALPAPARAQEPARRSPAPAGVSASLQGGEQPPGTLVTVRGKYAELVGKELTLAGDPTLYIVKKLALRRMLFQLEPHKDNIRVKGKVLPSQSRRSVEVLELELAPPDAELFRRRLEEASTLEPGERLDKLASLLKEMAPVYLAGAEAEFIALTRKVAKELLRAADLAIDPNDVRARVRQVQAVYEHLHDPQITYELLVDLNSKFPGAPEIVALFRHLSCRRYKGRWVTHSEFKKLEGFILYKGQWIKPRQKHFIDTIRSFRRRGASFSILRRRTEREYRLLSKKGQVEEGMKPEEVYAALGPADRVERRLYMQKEFDQWSYGDKYYYFYGGLLVAFPDK